MLKSMSKEQEKSIRLSRDGLMKMATTNYHDAITEFDNALKIDPECLLALQSRALCKTLMFEDLPNKDHQNQFEEIVSDLLRVSSLIRDILMGVFGQKSPKNTT